MGNCVSCTEPSSHEQPDRWLTDGDKKITELQTPGSLGAGASGGMSGKNSEGGGNGRDGFGNGSCTPGSASTPHHNHHLMISSLDGAASGPTSVSGSQKAEKKTFYSRIPPLGRSGSDKKSSIISNNTSSSIKDNNNAYSETKIAAVFEQYKDPHEDLILAEGIEKLCKDLEVKPEDFKVLVLAWKFGAEQMCRFTREEFYRGMKELKTDNVKGIQARLPDCVAEVLSDSTMFKDLYRFAFRFGLDNELGQRILPVEMATSLWRVVFSQREPPLLERWICFLDAHHHIRGIPRDTWNMFLNFVETVDNDLSSYDDTEAWPSLFDDFVEYENDRLNQNLTTSIVTNNMMVAGDKSDQMMMMMDDYTTIPPPAPFASTTTYISSSTPNSSEYRDGCSGSSSHNKSNSVKVVPIVTSTTTIAHHQLMSIDTSSSSGYTKIIHTPTTTSSNISAPIPILSSQLTYSSPTPVSASSYNNSTSVIPSKQGGGDIKPSSSSISSSTTPTPTSYQPFGYKSRERELSDV
ncbi:DCN1-like protein 3 [Orchesella cincta]|uniref:Defective in cullin neddylation protein n=1 Tax=Orchesella cincta TaxID=48709 RepID=A0A1D2MR77_ORCCI|nr:DCN1-like protein 3 [Orchesella cincta]